MFRGNTLSHMSKADFWHPDFLCPEILATFKLFILNYRLTTCIKSHVHFDTFRMFLFLNFLFLSVFNVLGSPASPNGVGKMSDYLNRVNTKKHRLVAY